MKNLIKRKCRVNWIHASYKHKTIDILYCPTPTQYIEIVKVQKPKIILNLVCIFRNIVLRKIQSAENINIVFRYSQGAVSIMCVFQLKGKYERFRVFIEMW